MAAGYGCIMAGRWIVRSVRARPGIIATAGAIALLGVLAADWQLASVALHEWPNTTSFVAAFRPLAARTNGPIFATAEQRVASYYSQEGSKWWLWETKGLSLDPAGVPRSRWNRYYARHLATGRYGLIALFYAAPQSGPALPAGTAPVARGGPRYAPLARLKKNKRHEGGVPAPTQAL